MSDRETQGPTLLGDEVTLLDVADRLIDHGTLVTGDATISVAGVDLIFLGLGVVLSSVETMERHGRYASAPPAGPPAGHERPGPGAASVAELEAMRRELAEVRAALPERIDVDPREVERGLARLVLSVVELIRRLLERQAIRRMEGGRLSEDEVERVGLALMRLEEKVVEMARLFRLERSDLALGLGPIGRLQ